MENLNVKEIRIKFGLSQSKLASLLGLSGHPRIVEYESDPPKRNPSTSVKMLLWLLDNKIITIKDLENAKNKTTN